MDNEKDILKDDILHRLPLRTPEGYFEQLNARLENIPEKKAKVFGLWAITSVAACIVLAFATGWFFTANRNNGEMLDSISYEYSRYYSSDLIPLTDPYLIQETDDEEESDDDIIEYLISGRTSADMIAYVLNE